MKKALIYAIVFTFVIGISAVASAEIGYGPLVLDDATVIAPKTGEVKGEISYLKVDEDTMGAAEDTTALGIEVRLDYGVIDKLEVGAAIPYLSISNGTDESGLGDITVGAKYAILVEDEATPGLSVGLDLVLPTGDEDLLGEDNDLDFVIKSAISKAVGPVDLHGNLDFTIWGKDDAAEETNIAYGAAVEYPINALTITGEIQGSNVEIGDDKEMALYAGLRYNVSDVLDVGGTLGIGLTDASPDLTIGAGVVYAF